MYEWMDDYHYKYLKYKLKYMQINQIGSGDKIYSLNKDEIILVKKRIQFLTHYTSLHNFFKIIKSGYLIHQGFDVVMMSIFPIR